MLLLYSFFYYLLEIPKEYVKTVFLSHFLIAVAIATSLDSMQIFTAHTFQNCQERRKPLLIDDVIVT